MKRKTKTLDPQAYIELLYEQRAKNDRNSVTLANTLSKDVDTLFKRRHQFVFELLQNADDTGEEKQALSVEFILLEEYLIVKHNGHAFTERDINKICDNAQQAQHDKLLDQNKTGYKGIGFKSVFILAPGGTYTIALLLILEIPVNSLSTDS